MTQNYINESEQDVEILLDKQDYLDYIDADMEAFYSIKSEQYEATVQ